MGNIKISFTTALFVLSFLVCVIVAVLFVDKNKSDEDDFPKSVLPTQAIVTPVIATITPSPTSAWQDVNVKQNLAGTQPPNPGMPVNPAEANMADLPIDPRAGGQQPQYPSVTPYTQETTPQAIITPNPYAGQSAEQIARNVRGRAFLNGQGPAITPPPMAVPGGMPGVNNPVATPAGYATPTRKSGYQPIKSNAPAMMGTEMASTPAPFNPFSQNFDQPPSHSQGPGGYDSMLQNLAGSQTPAATNGGSGWEPVQENNNPSGFHLQGSDSSTRPSLMIEKGKINPSGAANMPISGETLPPNGGAAAPIPTSGGLPSLSGSNPGGSLLSPPPTEGTPISEVPSDKMTLPPDSASKGSVTSAVDASRIPAGMENVFGANANVAAKVNTVVLSGEDAEKRGRVTAKLLNEKITEDNKQQKTRLATDDWVTIVSMAEEAKAKGTGISTGEIEKYAAMQPGLKLDDYKTSMKGEGFSEDIIQEDLKQIAIGEKWVEESVLKEFGEDKLKQIYNKTPDTFTPPKEYKVQEIFKLRPDNPTEKTKIVEEMNRLQRQASGGTDFGLLASQASDAPTKSKGGDLGWIDEESHISQGMAEALLKLKPGEVSSVVEDSNGYYIYRLAEVKTPAPGYEGGKEMVVKSLKGAMRNKLLAEAKKNQQVEVTHSKNKKVVSNRPEFNETSSGSNSGSKSTGQPSPRVSVASNNPNAIPASNVVTLDATGNGSAGFGTGAQPLPTGMQSMNNAPSLSGNSFLSGTPMTGAASDTAILQPPPEAILNGPSGASSSRSSAGAEPHKAQPDAGSQNSVPVGFGQPGQTDSQPAEHEKPRGIGSRIKSMFGRS